MASQTLRTLKLSLLADVSSFGKELDKAGSSFNKFSKGLETASKVATGVIGVLGGIAISSIRAASDLEETGAAVEQVFGARAARQLDQFARTAATALGQSRQQALSAAQTFGIFGTSAGLADDDLVEFTTSLVTLAADLASFNNTDVDTAINALGAALRGESEPIRQYGVLLDAATLKNRALADGIIETTEQALTPQQRTLAAYNEILAQTTLQQGDFERTSDGLANTQRTLQAELENFRVELGEELLPVVVQLLPILRDWVDRLKDIDPEQIVKVATQTAKLATAIVALNTALKVFATLRGAWAALYGVFGIPGLVVGGAAAATAYTLENLPPGYTGGAIPGLLEGQINPQREPTPTIVPPRRTQPPQVVINGIVAGSSYQVYRELELQLAAGTRAGIGAAR